MGRLFGPSVGLGLLLSSSLVLAAPAKNACAQSPSPIPPGEAAAGFLEVQSQHAPVAPIVVPYFIGLTRDKAQALANGASLTARFIGSPEAGARVVTQSLTANRRVTPHAVVQLRMAMVNSTVVPALIGLDRDAALAKAEGSALDPSFYGPASPDALVASQSLPSGQTVARGSSIGLQMEASKLLTVPDFTGRTKSQAEALAASSHLTPNFIGPVDAAARVVDQSPAAGSQVHAGAVEQLKLATLLTPGSEAVRPPDIR